MALLSHRPAGECLLEGDTWSAEATDGGLAALGEGCGATESPGEDIRSLG